MVGHFSNAVHKILKEIWWKARKINQTFLKIDRKMIISAYPKVLLKSTYK